MPGSLFKDIEMFSNFLESQNTSNRLKIKESWIKMILMKDMLWLISAYDTANSNENS